MVKQEVVNISTKFSNFEESREELIKGTVNSSIAATVNKNKQFYCLIFFSKFKCRNPSFWDTMYIKPRSDEKASHRFAWPPTYVDSQTFELLQTSSQALVKWRLATCDTFGLVVPSPTCPSFI